MTKYLVDASYTPDGTKGLVKDGGSGRRKLVEEMVKKLDGKLEAFYFAFGNHDVVAIVDLPNSVAATALSLAVNQTGAVQLKTHVLITPEEMDEATRKQVGYRAPGRQS